MADTDKKETIQTDNPETIRACCHAMHEGRAVTIHISGMAFTGQVVTIRRLDDGQFQISLRITE